MSGVSLQGKKWIYKDFDQANVNFIKENYSLDEITAKLLSIRNIKNDNINTYLEPSIKSLIPNPNVLKDMTKSIDRIFKAIQNREKIGIFV